MSNSKNDRYYNINLNAIIGIHDSLDLSSTKVSIINSNDTIFTKRPFLLKDTIIESHRNIVYSLDFNVPYPPSPEMSEMKMYPKYP